MHQAFHKLAESCNAVEDDSHPLIDMLWHLHYFLSSRGLVNFTSLKSFSRKKPSSHHLPKAVKDLTINKYPNNQVHSPATRTEAEVLLRKHSCSKVDIYIQHTISAELTILTTGIYKVDEQY